MVYIVLFILEIITLYFLSRKISSMLSRFMSINFLFLIFLPGVIIHELSHMIMAVVLFVPVGNMEFSPKESDTGLKLGSVEIAKTDPIRRSIIGFAPVFVGLMVIVGIVYFFSQNISFFLETNIYFALFLILITIYFLFAISNTMFSSRVDMEGTIEILITLAILFGIAYCLGFRIPFSIDSLFTKEVVGIIQKVSIFLLAPIAIDLFILGTIRILRKVGN